MSLRDLYESFFLTAVLLLCFRSCTLKQVSLEDDTVRCRDRGETVAVWYAVEWTAQWRRRAPMMKSRRQPAACESDSRVLKHFYFGMLSFKHFNDL